MDPLDLMEDVEVEESQATPKPVYTKDLMDDVEAEESQAPPKPEYTKAPEWATACYTVLDEDARKSMQVRYNNKTFSLGTDCTGANAQYHALKHVVRSLRVHGDTKLAIDHLFTSEIDTPEGDPMRSYIVDR
jgi:hypothetical protein